MDKQKQQEAYKNYVKQKTPVHNLPLNMLKAFITGGIICTIGQGILNYCRHLGIEKDISAGWTSMIHGNRLQDIYHSRTGDIIWNLLKLGTWSGVLDIEDFESDVKNF